jgi:hypothetical protein
MGLTGGSYNVFYKIFNTQAACIHMVASQFLSPPECVHVRQRL